MLVQKKQRLHYIDFFKAIAMVLVVIGHINYANQGMKEWVYSFHMPAFFFISGTVLKANSGDTLKKATAFVRKRFFSLMLPYLIWAMIYAEFSIPNVLKIFYGSYHTIYRSGSLTSLWFLPVLFTCDVFFALASCVFKERFNLSVKIVAAAISFGIAIALPDIKVGYPWCFNVSFSAFGFLLLGNAVFTFMNRFYEYSLNVNGLKRVMLIIAGICISFFGTMLFRLNLSYVEEKVLMSKAIYGNYILFLAAAFFGIMFIFFVSLLLDNVVPKRSVLESIISYIGMNTLVIFAVQKPIIGILKKIFEIVLLPNGLVLVLACVLTLVGSCLVAVAVNLYIPALAGKVSDKK